MNVTFVVHVEGRSSRSGALSTASVPSPVIRKASVATPPGFKKASQYLWPAVTTAGGTVAVFQASFAADATVPRVSKVAGWPPLSSYMPTWTLHPAVVLASRKTDILVTVPVYLASY